MPDLGRPDLRKILKNEFIRLALFITSINDKSLLSDIKTNKLSRGLYNDCFERKMLKLMNTYIYIFHCYNKIPLGILLKSLDNLHGQESHSQRALDSFLWRIENTILNVNKTEQGYLISMNEHYFILYHHNDDNSVYKNGEESKTLIKEL